MDREESRSLVNSNTYIRKFGYGVRSGSPHPQGVKNKHLTFDGHLSVDQLDYQHAKSGYKSYNFRGKNQNLKIVDKKIFYYKSKITIVIA